MFFLLLDFLHGIAGREGDPPEKRQQAGQNQTGPCTAIFDQFEDRVGERHQRSSKPALLGQCDPVVNEQGNPNKPKKMIPSPSPFRGRGKFVFLGGKPNSARCGPVCGFGGRLGKRHQQSPRPALLEACDPVVSESGDSSQPQARESWFRLHSERGG